MDIVLAFDDETCCPVVVIDAAEGVDEALRMCSALRSVSAVPIIVLSTRDDSEERIRGLEAGADDYLVKPFNPRELRARIRVIARRASFAPRGGSMSGPREYSFGEWRLDVPSHTLRHSSGSGRALTASEFRLLETLVKHAQQVLPRSHLLQSLHGEEWQRYEHSIEARMSRMRRLLRSPTLIRNVYGVGYVFDGPVMTS